MEKKVTYKKILIGKVVSDKMNKTIIVNVSRRIKHPKYQRYVTLFNKFKAHDEKNQAKMGDKVKIIETRPLSKDKRWRLSEVLESKGVI